jgi:hypothetical protein
LEEANLLLERRLDQEIAVRERERETSCGGGSRFWGTSLCKS